MHAPWNASPVSAYVLLSFCRTRELQEIYLHPVALSQRDAPD